MIYLLLDLFLHDTAKELGTNIPSYKEELLALLKQYSFPGNIRELRGMVYEAMVKHTGKNLSIETFALNITSNNLHADIENKNIESLNEYLEFCSTLPDIHQVTSALINEALARSDNNKTLAAKLIKMNRGTLRNRLEEYNV